MALDASRDIEILSAVGSGISAEVDILAQKLRATDGSGFYPQDVTAREIERLARTKPLAVDNHTRIIRDPSGRLEVLDYRDAYPENFANLGLIYSCAAGEIQSSDLRRFLSISANVFVDTSRSFEEIYAQMMANAGQPILPVLGWEEYYDTLKKVKSVPVFWLSQLDETETAVWQNYLDAAIEAFGEEFQDMSIPRIVLRLGTWRNSSHIVAVEEGWSANTQPNSPEWLARHGAIIFFEEKLRKKRFESGRLRAMRQFVDPEVLGEYTDGDLDNGDRRLLYLHEGNHPLVKKMAKSQLGEVDLVVQEALPTALAATLAAKMDPDHLGLITLATMGWMINDFFSVQDTYKDDYVRGYNALLGHFSQEGVVELQNGLLTWKNLKRVSRAIQDFGVLLREGLVRGDRVRITQILSQYEATGHRTFDEMARLRASHKRTPDYMS